MISRAIVVFGGLSLAACAPSVPDSGVGFGGSYGSYVQNSANQTYGAPAVAQPQAQQPWSPASAAAAIDRAQGAPVNNAPVYGAPVAADPAGYQPTGYVGQAQPVVAGVITGAKISDENDFNAVSSRESIESDAQRIAQNRAQYVVVQPKELPQRPGDTGPNIVAYALRTTNVPGQPMFSRSRLFAKDYKTACAAFASPDLAQQAFLANGGPDKDKLGVDPDGDGFACAWDPRAFRTALQ